MAPSLTLHQGEQEQVFSAHPTELARRALIVAAAVETPEWGRILHRVASALPHREPLSHEKGGK